MKGKVGIYLKVAEMVLIHQKARCLVEKIHPTPAIKLCIIFPGQALCHLYQLVYLTVSVQMNGRLLIQVDVNVAFHEYTSTMCVPAELFCL